MIKQKKKLQIKMKYKLILYLIKVDLKQSNVVKRKKL